jgi:serine/threonine protein kinase
MYVLVSGESPWPADETEAAILSGKYDFHSEPWERVSAEAKDLIDAMMQTNPDDRIAPDEAQDHQWFEQFFPSHGKPKTETDAMAPAPPFSPMNNADDWDDMGGELL